MFAQQFIPQDFTRLTTPRHRIDIEVCEGLFRKGIIVTVSEHGVVVLKDEFQKIVLDVLSP